MRVVGAVTIQYNHHGTLISLNDKGILICGCSGSGKTSLALHLYRRAKAARSHALIIADDQVILSANSGSLYGACPEAILGKIEIRGFGIVDISNFQNYPVPIDWYVELVPEEQAVRFYDDQTVELAGVSVPSLALAENDTERAANAILAALGMPLGV